MPLYRIHQVSNIDDRTVAAGEEINVDARHIPGPHWEPLDDEARAICTANGHEFTGEVPDILPALTDELGKAGNAAGGMTAEQMTAAIANGVTAAMTALAEARALDAGAPNVEAMSDERLAEIVAKTVASLLPKPEDTVALIAAAVQAALPKPEDQAAMIAQSVAEVLDRRKVENAGEFVAAVQAIVGATDTGKKR